MKRLAALLAASLLLAGCTAAHKAVQVPEYPWDTAQQAVQQACPDAVAEDNSVLIDGFAELEDVEEELGISFGDVEMETLNGLLTELLGHIPSDSDLDQEITAYGYRFKILSLGNRTIGKVRAEKINEKDTKGESEQCQDIQNSRT